MTHPYLSPVRAKPVKPVNPVQQAIFQPSTLALAIALACSAPGLAQAQTSAQAVPLALSAQPLDAALNALSAATGTPIGFAPALVAGKKAPALNGTLTPAQALERLLAGSGLVGMREGNAIVIQPAPPPGAAVTLKEVVVTAAGERSGITEGTGSFTTRTMSSATHLPLTMRETPQSVTVLTSARIEADNLLNLTDIAKTTPGLTLNSRELRPMLQSRGHTVESVAQDGIATLYDWSGGDSLGNLAMQDRVEVVRGATGLMQGTGNPSAAINMIRKRPTSTWQFKGSASAGSWDDYRLMADVSGPLTEDGRVRGRVVGYVQDASDFQSLAFNDKHLGYATVDVDLTPRTTLNVGYSQLYSNRSSSWGGMPTSYSFEHLHLPRSTFIGADWEYNKTKADTLYASLAHDFGNGWNLDLNATYVEGSYGMLGTWLLPTPHVGGHGHTWWGTQSTREQKAADIKLSGPVSWFGRQHDLVFGTTVNRQNERDTQWFKSWDDPDFLTSGVDLTNWNHVIPRPDTSGQSPWRYVYSTRYKQDSLYSAGRFNMTDTLDLLLGARLDWYDRVLDTGSSEISFSENAHLTKYVGLTWKFADQYSAYASYTDVFQPQSQRGLSGDLLPPKSGRNYEVGLKGEYLGGALNSSIALFRIDESNRAVYLRDQSACPVPAGCFAAAGQVRTEGVDIELQGAITPNWQIGAGLTWSEVRYRKDANPANIDRRLTTAEPTTLFKLSTQYTLPGALNRLTLGGRVNWQSKMYADGENIYGEMVRNQQSARAIVDLSVGYRFSKNVNLKLDVNNVFNKVYYTAIGADDWIWSANEAYGRPRNVLLTLNASF